MAQAGDQEIPAQSTVVAAARPEQATGWASEGEDWLRVPPPCPVPGPVRLPALRPARRRGLVSLRPSGRGEGSCGRGGPVRPPRCLRGPQAAQGPRRHRAGGREGGRPGAWRRGDRGTGARRPPMAAGPSQPRPAWGRVGGRDHGRHGDAAPGAGAPPPQPPLPISPSTCRHRPPAARHAGLRPIGPRGRSLPRPRRDQSAAATAALQQGGARRVPIKGGVRGGRSCCCPPRQLWRSHCRCSSGAPHSGIPTSASAHTPPGPSAASRPSCATSYRGHR